MVVDMPVVRNWAAKYISNLMDREGGAATRDGILRARNKPVNESFVLGFDLKALYRRLEELCPITCCVIKAFSTTRRQEQKRDDTSTQKHETVRGSLLTSYIFTKFWATAYSRISHRLARSTQPAEQLVETSVWSLPICDWDAAPDNLRLV